MRMRVLQLLAISILTAASAQATTLVRLSLEQLSQAATVVIRGRVIAQESHWNAAHTQIATRTTLQVVQTVKGSVPSEVVVEQPGGVVGNVRVRVAGTAFFKPQDELYLFLEPARPDTSQFLLVGMLQGAYRIVRDPRNGAERVIHPLSGFAVSKRELVDEVDKTAALPEPVFRRQLLRALAAPIEIPRGTTLPVVITAATERNSGACRVSGATTTAVFPNDRVVVPAGSAVEGTAELATGRWRIHWSEISLRGRRVAVRADNEQPARVPLADREMLMILR